MDEAVRTAVLHELALDGRAPIEAIVRHTGLRRQQVQAVLLGVKTQIRGIVHPSVMGLEAYALLRVRPQATAQAAAQVLAEHPSIPYVAVVASDTPVIAEIRTATKNELATTLDELRALPAVRDVAATEYLDIHKDASVRTRPYHVTSVDDADRALLTTLQRDGRASFAKLSQVVGMSTAATRVRVLRLLESGVVHIGIRRAASELPYEVGVAVRVAGPVHTVVESLCLLPEVSYVASSLGGAWSLIATISTSTREDAARVLDDIRAMDAVTDVESWTHLQLIKEQYDQDTTVAGDSSESGSRLLTTAV